MIVKKSLLVLTFSAITLGAFGQTKNDRTNLGKSHAEQELKSALTDKSRHNIVNYNTVIIKDSTTAINIAEPILFSIYGRENITKQRPYESFFINNHWIISGTLTKGYLGGTFLIIIDGRDCKILKITHGK
jgi:hypothetical protein